MKRIFSILAAALIIFGAASCKKSSKGDPEAPKTTFAIAVSDITDGNCSFTIIPSDNTVEYMLVFMKKADLGSDLVKTMKDYLASDQYTYEKYKTDGCITKDQTIRTETPYGLSANTQYVLVVFQIDKDLNISGNVTASEPFYTLPENYFDLGLPSGTIWNFYNVKNPNHTGGLWTWDEAMAYSLPSYASIPTNEQWLELINNCDWSWDDTYKFWRVRSRKNSTNYIVIATDGNGECGTTDVYHKGEYSFYWSSTVVEWSSEGNAWAYIGSKSDYKNYEEEFSKCTPLALRLVAANPNKK